MWIRRLLALVVAVALVAAAVWIRDRRVVPGVAATSDDVRVVCVTELADVCAALESPAEVEDATGTVERLATAGSDVDVWVTVTPWPALAAQAATASGPTTEPAASSAVLARSPVVLAARRDRVAALASACGGSVTWPCLGTQAGAAWTDSGGQARWGRVKVGMQAPADTIGGSLALAQAAGAFFDGAVPTTRLLDDPSWFAWVSTFADAAAPAVDPLERMLLTGAADVEFTPVLEVAASARLRAAAARAGDIELRALDPVVTADVVVVGYGADAQAAVDRVTADLEQRLVAAGWRDPEATGGASELPGLTLPPCPDATADGCPDNGVPSGATMQRLQQTWSEVTR